MAKPILFTFTLLLTFSLSAQWEPGQVYREYVWTTPETAGEAFLRVGGRYGYATRSGATSIPLGMNVDLTGAVRAEVEIEKVMSHEDSRDLKIAFNGNPALSVPEPATVPAPTTEYMYHLPVSVEVPLAHLRAGDENTFAITLDTVQRWNWPQNLLYAVTLRVYYPTETPSEIDYPKDEVPALSYLRTNATAANRAQYVFVGRSVDWSGLGQAERVHWQTHRGDPHHIIGTSVDAEHGFPVAWDTRWLPDQDSFGVQARLTGKDGKYRISAVRRGLRLAARPFTVELATGEAPRNWVTRSGEFSQTVDVSGPVERATAYRLHWRSWSPCYGNGLFLNGHLLWVRSEDCYVYAEHAPEYRGVALKYLQTGVNTFRTGLTPLFRGEMVHGMEVQWPGIQLLLRYE